MHKLECEPRVSRYEERMFYLPCSTDCAFSVLFDL